jgi:branched-chain amino acid transport system substrate-binding protein
MLNRRRFTALAASTGLAAGLSSWRLRAAEAGPLKLGVLTDMSSVYSDQTGAGSVANERRHYEPSFELR